MGKIRTVNVALMLFEAYVAIAACVAVIVVDPAPTSVTVVPLTVATAKLLLVYVNAPLLLVVGAVSSNDASPNTLAGTEKLDRIGVGLTSLKVTALPKRVVTTINTVIGRLASNPLFASRYKVDVSVERRLPMATVCVMGWIRIMIRVSIIYIYILLINQKYKKVRLRLNVKGIIAVITTVHQRNARFRQCAGLQ